MSPEKGERKSSTPAPAIAALAVRVGRSVVILPLRFLWMPQRCARTIERFGLGQRKLDNWFDELEGFVVGRFPIKIIGLVANGVALAAFHSVVVVVENLLEWPAINHRLIALETFPLFSFERFDGYRAKFNSLHRSPRFRVAFSNANAIKPGGLERRHETLFRECAGDTAAPKFRVALHFFGHFLVAHDVRDDSASAFSEDAENFSEKLSLRFRFDQVEDAI